MRYRVLVPNNLCQAGQYLPVGAEIEMEPHVAATEFAGRLARVDDGTVVAAPASAEDAAFERELSLARPHERESLIAAREQRLAAAVAAAAATASPASPVPVLDADDLPGDGPLID